MWHDGEYFDLCFSCSLIPPANKASASHDSEESIAFDESIAPGEAASIIFSFFKTREVCLKHFPTLTSFTHQVRYAGPGTNHGALGEVVQYARNEVLANAHAKLAEQVIDAEECTPLAADDVENGGSEMRRSGYTKRSIIKGMREALVSFVKHSVGDCKVLHCLATERTLLCVSVSEDRAKELATRATFPLALNESLFTSYMRASPDFIVPHQYYSKFAQAVGSRIVANREGKGREEGLSELQVWKTYKRTTVEDGPGLSIFRKIDAARLAYFHLQEELNFQALYEFDVIESVWIPPLDREGTASGASFRRDPFFSWRSLSQWLPWSKPPLDLIRSSNGESVALHAAFTSLLIRALSVPAAISLVFHFYRAGKSGGKRFETLRVLVGLSLAMCAEWVRARWLLEEALLRQKWGTALASTKYSGLMRRAQRQEFKSDSLIKSSVRPFEYLPHYTKAKKRARRIIANFVTFIAIMVVVVIVNEDAHEYLFTSMKFPDPLDFLKQTLKLEADINLSRQAFTSILAVTTSIFWRRLAVRVTDFENHAFDDSYERKLVERLFLFSAFDFLLPLFYLAFFKRFIQPCYDEDPIRGYCNESLRDQLFSFLIATGAANVLELGVPHLTALWHQHYRLRFRPLLRLSSKIPWTVKWPTFDRIDHKKLSSLEKDACKPEYEADDYRNDFESLFLLMKIVVLFGAVWTPGVSCVLVLLIIKSRVHYKKMELTRASAFSMAVTADLGPWLAVLHYVSTLSQISNLAIFNSSDTLMRLSAKSRASIALLALIVLFLARESVAYVVDLQARTINQKKVQSHMSLLQLNLLPQKFAREVYSK